MADSIIETNDPVVQATLLTYAKPEILKQFSQQDKDFIVQK